jgi:hypothetical protein
VVEQCDRESHATVRAHHHATSTLKGNKKMKHLCLKMGAALCAMAIPIAQASVTYTFTDTSLTNFFGNPAGPTSGPGNFNATLTLRNALAAGTTTTIHGEYNGLALLAPDLVGVSGFDVTWDARGSNFNIGYPITSDPQRGDISYTGGIPAANSYTSFIRYSQVNGSITTDAAGNVADWNILFSVDQALGPNQIWLGPDPRPPGTADLMSASPGIGPDNVRFSSQLLNGAFSNSFTQGFSTQRGTGAWNAESTGRAVVTVSADPSNVPVPALPLLLGLGFAALTVARKRTIRNEPYTPLLA